jgi:periplasmic divalent cation tolerance protein
MRSARSYSLVLVTAPDAKVARQLVRSALQTNLIACGNLVVGVESHYRWQGRIESGREVLCLLKARKAALPRLERLILALHPYDTPEFIAVPLDCGTERYLAWLESATGLPPKIKKARRTKAV